MFFNQNIINQNENYPHMIEKQWACTCSLFCLALTAVNKASQDLWSFFCSEFCRALFARYNRDSWSLGYQSSWRTWCASLDDAILCKYMIPVDFSSFFCAALCRALFARRNRDSWSLGYQRSSRTWCTSLDYAILWNFHQSYPDFLTHFPDSIFASIDELWILLKLSACVLSFPWWCLGFFWLNHLSLPPPIKIYTFSFDYLQWLTGVFHVKNSSLS